MTSTLKIESSRQLEETRHSVVLATEGHVDPSVEIEQIEIPEDEVGSKRSAIIASQSVLGTAPEVHDVLRRRAPAEWENFQLNPVQPLADTTVAPWRLVAHLILKTQSDVFHGSAFFITRSVLLTAGHNLFFHDIRRTPDVTVFPGRNGNAGYGVFKPKAIRVAAGWLHGHPDADFGVIALDQPLGLGWFGVRDLNQNDGTGVYMSGYPANQQPRKQCAATGTIVDATQRRFAYSVQTLDGQSGGPVALTGMLTAVGIHVARPNGPAQAIRITDVVKAEIIGWLQGL